MGTCSGSEDHSDRAARSRAATGVFGGRLISRLGAGGYGPEDGRVGMLDALVCAGLTIPEGIVLGRGAHSEFMKQSGLLQEMLDLAEQAVDASRLAQDLRLAYGRSPVAGELNRVICEALIDLGAPSVAVVSESSVQRGLTSIPGVKEALKEAWLSLGCLEHQVGAAARGEELPTRLLIVQAEPTPVAWGGS